TQFAAVGLWRTARCADSEGHVRVLGVGEDEVLVAVRVGVNPGQFAIKYFFYHVRRSCSQMSLASETVSWPDSAESYRRRISVEKQQGYQSKRPEPFHEA